MRRKRTVEKLIKEHFWSGFWKGIRGGQDDGWGLSYVHMPDWYDRVADIAEHAGWQAAADLMSDREKWQKARICFPSDDPPVIPGSVYAECYGEARLAGAK